jgi:hypothetical protein
LTLRDLDFDLKRKSFEVYSSVSGVEVRVMSDAAKKHRIKVSGKIGRKSLVVVSISGAEMRFSSVTEAVQVLTRACVEVYDWSEDEYQGGRTNRRFVEH